MGKETRRSNRHSPKNVADLPSSPIVLYDGVCALCNGFVRCILKVDRAGTIRFAPLQGETASRLFDNLDQGQPPTGEDVETILYIRRPQTRNPEVNERSDAVLKILEDLGGLWKVFTVFTLIPRALRDRIYRWIADHRYGWFGQYDQCPLPPAEQSHRFLP